MPLIQDVQTDEFWTDVTLPQLKTVRKKLRDLVKFIEKSKRKVVYTDFRRRDRGRHGGRAHGTRVQH